MRSDSKLSNEPGLCSFADSEGIRSSFLRLSYGWGNGCIVFCFEKVEVKVFVKTRCCFDFYFFKYG